MKTITPKTVETILRLMIETSLERTLKDQKRKKGKGS